MEKLKTGSDKVHYRLDPSMGPSGATAGYVFLVIGLFTVWDSYSGAILIILGSFMAFSFSECTVDFNNYRIRFSNNLFGFIRVGKWVYVSHNMMVGLSDAHMVYRVYSLSNRSIDVSNNELRIYLFNEEGRRVMTICRFKKIDQALVELARLSDLLGLQIKEGKYDKPVGQIKIE